MSQVPSNQGKLISFGVMGFFALVVLLTLSGSIFRTIQPGENAVLFKRFGGGLDTENVKGQGFLIIAPWNRLITYDTRTKEAFEEMSVLSKNGLTIAVELSYRYQPITKSIGLLHEEIGPNYLEVIVKPEIRSATREVIGKYLPEELYSTKREAIQDEILERTKEKVGKKHIVLDEVLIREVALPASLKVAIEKKLEEEQLSFQFEFKLDRERKEAERKIIEATAKAEANRILNASLTSNILKDKGIEATLELAKSPNSKVVVVGGAEGGLPLILGN
ncbi:MAG: prohibitin family protein [Saprospiraceae bacterium]|nr:prohibitin family protein [Saprospiraceae bacterium]